MHMYVCVYIYICIQTATQTLPPKLFSSHWKPTSNCFVSACKTVWVVVVVVGIYISIYIFDGFVLFHLQHLFHLFFPLHFVFRTGAQHLCIYACNHRCNTRITGWLLAVDNSKQCDVARKWSKNNKNYNAHTYILWAYSHNTKCFCCVIA